MNSEALYYYFPYSIKISLLAVVILFIVFTEEVIFSYATQAINLWNTIRKLQ